MTTRQRHESSAKSWKIFLTDDKFEVAGEIDKFSSDDNLDFNGTGSRLSGSAVDEHYDSDFDDGTGQSNDSD